MLEKKKKLRGTNKKSHKKILVKPHYLPPPPFAPFFILFFCLLNLRSEVRTQPPSPQPPASGGWGPPRGKTILDRRLHSTDFFKTDFHMVSADQLSFHLWKPWLFSFFLIIMYSQLIRDRKLCRYYLSTWVSTQYVLNWPTFLFLSGKKCCTLSSIIINQIKIICLDPRLLLFSDVDHIGPTVQWNILFAFSLYSSLLSIWYFELGWSNPARNTG